MSKKIKINGEFTKEELQEKIKEFDKPVWEIKKVKKYIELHKDGKYIRSLLHEEGEHPAVNISTISRDMATVMEDLMETKDVLDNNKIGGCVYFNTRLDDGYAHSARESTSDKHFKTEETTELAAKLLNDSKDMRDGIKRMGE